MGAALRPTAFSGERSSDVAGPLVTPQSEGSFLPGAPASAYRPIDGLSG